MAHPWNIFQRGNFFSPDFGPSRCERPPKDGHMPQLCTSALSLLVVLNSCLPLQLAMLFEAGCLSALRNTGEGSEGERMGLMKRAGCTLCEVEIGVSPLFLATTLHTVTRLLED